MIVGQHWPIELTPQSKTAIKLGNVSTKVLVPSPHNIFNAVKAVCPQDVKVIIIGQDPYINGEAHGLAFSSQLGMTPSLRVIFKELKEEYGIERTNPNLTDWAQQGVLLLNTILTTERGITLAHKDFGWQSITKEIVRYVINLQKPITVMLWGNYAKNFWSDTIKLVDVDTSHINLLSACHPQAENYGSCKFTGCNHFRKANEWLVNQDLKPIKWL